MLISLAKPSGEIITPVGVFSKLLKFSDNKSNRSSFLSKLFIRLSPLKFLIPFSKPYDAYVLGISREGALIVEKIDGTLEKVISGECIIKN